MSTRTPAMPADAPSVRLDCTRSAAVFRSVHTSDPTWAHARVLLVVGRHLAGSRPAHGDGRVAGDRARRGTGDRGCTLLRTDPYMRNYRIRLLPWVMTQP